jgi:hypothetical protein
VGGARREKIKILMSLVHLSSVDECISSLEKTCERKVESLEKLENALARLEIYQLHAFQKDIPRVYNLGPVDIRCSKEHLIAYIKHLRGPLDTRDFKTLGIKVGVKDKKDPNRNLAKKSVTFEVKIREVSIGSATLYKVTSNIEPHKIPISYTVMDFLRFTLNTIWTKEMQFSRIKEIEITKGGVTTRAYDLHKSAISVFMFLPPQEVKYDAEITIRLKEVL